MTQQIEMQALREFTYVGRDYVRGERFQIEPVHAAALSYAQHARLLEPGETVPEPVAVKMYYTQSKTMTPEAPKAGARRTRVPRAKRAQGVYQRKDISPSSIK